MRNRVLEFPDLPVDVRQIVVRIRMPRLELQRASVVHRSFVWSPQLNEGIPEIVVDIRIVGIKL